jgi:hypothetical protein
MNNLIEMEMDDGATIWVYGMTAPQGGGVVRAAVGETVKQKFKEAIVGLKPLATSIFEQFRGLAHPPDKAEVEFGFGFEAKGGIVIAEGGSKASFKVKLTWNREATPANQGTHLEACE